jgi:formate--tetrahydrofolate ligase
MAKFDVASLDPPKLADWQVAEEAEKHMTPVTELAEAWGITKEELLPYGHYLGKVDFINILKRLSDRPNGKYIDVTAITPTPLGEGKSTTTMGLVEGLGQRGRKVSGAIRQPQAAPPPTSRLGGGRRSGSVHPPDPLLAGPHRRHRQHHQRPQPGDGGAAGPHAARVHQQR